MSTLEHQNRNHISEASSNLIQRLRTIGGQSIVRPPAIDIEAADHIEQLDAELATLRAAPLRGKVREAEFMRGVIAALGALAPHSTHGDVLHDEIVKSVGKDSLYLSAEAEDVEWAGLDPVHYAAVHSIYVEAA